MAVKLILITKNNILIHPSHSPSKTKKCNLNIFSHILLYFVFLKPIFNTVAIIYKIYNIGVNNT